MHGSRDKVQTPPPKRWHRLLISLALVHLASSLSLAVPTDAGTPLPAPELVVDRILARAKMVAEDTRGCAYTYEQRTRLEELDAQGKVIQTTEKTYRVSLIQGFPFSRLISIQGKTLSPAELRKEDQREQEFMRKISARDFESMVKNQETWITRELMDRYDFTVQAREVHAGRPTLVVDFVPHLIQPPVYTVQDRILGRLAGRLWVDEADAEVAKLEIHLTSGFSLGWLGILGSVQQCHARLERRRQPEGCWINSRHSVFIVGRKILSPVRLRSIAESSLFQAT
jgi:hypothetical protein